MSDSRTFQSPDLSAPLGLAISQYHQQKKNAEKAIEERRTSVNKRALTTFSIFTVPYLLWLGYGIMLAPAGSWGGDFCFGLFVTVVYGFISMMIFGMRTSNLDINEELGKLPAHTKMHREHFEQLLRRIEVWEEFMKVIRQGETVEDLGEMGETAYRYQEKLFSLVERWQNHLNIVGDAEIRVTKIHHEIKEAISWEEIRDLQAITVMLGQRGHVQAKKQLAEVVDIEGDVISLHKEREKVRVKEE